MGGYTRAVSGQRLAKYVPFDRQHVRNNETVGLGQWKSLFSTWSVQGGYMQEKVRA
jgi:hypothetical protein